MTPYRETGEPFKVSTSVGINKTNERCVHEGRWSWYERKQAMEITLPACAMVRRELADRHSSGDSILNASLNWPSISYLAGLGRRADLR